MWTKKGQLKFPLSDEGVDSPTHIKGRNVSAWPRGVEVSLGGAGISSEEPSLCWRSSVSIPRVCRDLHRGVFVACGGAQWHHPHIQQSRADKTGRLPAGTPPGSQKKGSGCFLPIFVCEPNHNKAASRWPLSFKLYQMAWPPEACGYFAKVIMTLKVTQMEEMTWRHTKPWLTIQRLVKLCGYVWPVQVCGWAIKIGLEFH